MKIIKRFDDDTAVVREANLSDIFETVEYDLVDRVIQLLPLEYKNDDVEIINVVEDELETLILFRIGDRPFITDCKSTDSFETIANLMIEAVNETFENEESEENSTIMTPLAAVELPFKNK